MKKVTQLNQKIIFGLCLSLMIITLNASNSRNLQYTQPNCNIYRSDGSCEKCSYRFYKISGDHCNQVSDQCQTWNDSNGNCTSCYDGYSLSEGVCSLGDTQEPLIEGNGKLDANCQCYTDQRVCKTCYEGYYFNCEGVCTQLSYQCLEASKITGKCTTCQDDYYPDSNGQCQLESSIPDDHCKYYEYMNKFNGKWQKVWFLGCDKVCVACQPNYFLDQNNVCQFLPSHCIAADTSGNCLKCSNSYQVDQETGKCVAQITNDEEKQDNCIQYGYTDSNGKNYAKWFWGASKICIRCADSFYLDNKQNQCVKLPENCEKINGRRHCLKCCQGYQTDQSGQCIKVNFIKPEEFDNDQGNQGCQKELSSLDQEEESSTKTWNNEDKCEQKEGDCSKQLSVLNQQQSQSQAQSQDISQFQDSNKKGPDCQKQKGDQTASSIQNQNAGKSSWSKTVNSSNLQQPSVADDLSEQQQNSIINNGNNY